MSGFVAAPPYGGKPPEWVARVYDQWDCYSTDELADKLIDCVRALKADPPGFHIAEALYDDAYDIRWVLNQRWKKTTPGSWLKKAPLEINHDSDPYMTDEVMEAVLGMAEINEQQPAPSVRKRMWTA